MFTASNYLDTPLPPPPQNGTCSPTSTAGQTVHVFVAVLIIHLGL